MKIHIDKKWIILSFLIGIYVAFFCCISYLKYNSYGYGDFDLAIDAQSLWNILHGSIISSIHGIPFLGNHMRFILFLLAPIYAIFPSPLTLLFLQSIALGLGALGIFLIAKIILDEGSAFIFAFIYLIYPALGYLNLYEFHPTAFATCFLIFMFYFYLKEKFRWFIVFLMLALLCQENISLALAFFAIYAWIQKKDKKWIFAPFLIGAIYFILSVFVLMPAFSRNTIQFFKLYSHLGNGLLGAAKNIVLHPVSFIGFAFSLDKLLYLKSLFGPLSFLSLLSPAGLIPAVPLFMQHLLSLRVSEVTIFYHYQAELIPFVFISAIYGFKKLSSVRLINEKKIFFQSVVVILACMYAFTQGPFVPIVKNFSEFKKDHLDLQKDRLIAMIPKDASVLATFEFQPKLANRKNLYSLHHVYSGFYTLSDNKYDVPDSIDYIIMNAMDEFAFETFKTQDSSKNIRSLVEKEDYGLVEAIDNLALFKRNYKSHKKLYRIISKLSPISNKDKILSGKIFDSENNLAGQIDLIDIDTKQEADNIIDVQFTWQCIKETKADLGIILYFYDRPRDLVYIETHPIGYRIYPTSVLTKDENVKESFRTLFPWSGFTELTRIDVIDLSSRARISSKLLFNDNGK